MQMNFLKSIVIGLVLTLTMSVSLAQQVFMVDETGVIVERNEHLATFDGIAYHQCLGMTSLCPDQCGHSGNMASFYIDKHLASARFNEFGDTRSDRFMVLIDNGFPSPPLVNNEVFSTMHDLKRGDKVLLSWNHLYVTRQIGEVTSQFPERPINFILPLTDSQAAVIPTVPAPIAGDGFEGVLNRYYVSLTRFGGKVQGQALFNIEHHIFTYYYNDLATREFLSTYIINPSAVSRTISNEINRLRKDDFALIAFRRDIIDRNIVSTPLFVIRLTADEATRF